MTENEIMLELIWIFLLLLSVCKIGKFGDSLDFDSGGNLNCIFLNNWSCQARILLVNIKPNETVSYQFTPSVYKCGGN